MDDDDVDGNSTYDIKTTIDTNIANNLNIRSTSVDDGDNNRCRLVLIATMVLYTVPSSFVYPEYNEGPNSLWYFFSTMGESSIFCSRFVLDTITVLRGV